jgi:hypothetical protein
VNLKKVDDEDWRWLIVTQDTVQQQALVLVVLPVGSVGQRISLYL